MDEHTKKWIQEIGHLSDLDRETVVELHKLAQPIAVELKVDVGSVVAMMLYRFKNPGYGQIYPT